MILEIHQGELEPTMLVEVLGRVENLSVSSRGTYRLAGGLGGSLLLLASNNLTLFLTPSKKIYNTHQKNVSNMHTIS
jgi:hypothetical protein